MKFFLTVLISISCLTSYSQISFERGYFITTKGEEVKCFIKNREWVNNPTQFEYKTDSLSEALISTIENVQEFAINYGPKYQRFLIKIDKSSNDINKLSLKRSPELSEETLFLKVLIKGKATLYSYETSEFSRFFYRIDQDSIQQLIYKSYLTPAKQVAQNQSYKQQLLMYVKCNDSMTKKAENADYSQKSLTKYFINYNQCHDPSFSVATSKKRDSFNLTLRPGVNFAAASIQNSLQSELNTEFDRKPGFRFGLEAEIFLPFNKNKWAVLIEPTFQSYKDEQNNTSIDYKSIEMPLGIRYYIFLNEKSKLFVNGSFTFDFAINSTIDFETNQDLDIETFAGPAFGIGYNYGGKYSIEMRYTLDRKLVPRGVYWSTEYNSISVILGYKLF